MLTGIALIFVENFLSKILIIAGLLSSAKAVATSGYERISSMVFSVRGTTSFSPLKSTVLLPKPSKSIFLLLTVSPVKMSLFSICLEILIETPLPKEIIELSEPIPTATPVVVRIVLKIFLLRLSHANTMMSDIFIAFPYVLFL